MGVGHTLVELRTPIKSTSKSLPIYYTIMYRNDIGEKGGEQI